ncbi:hypothetical protein ABIA40_000403 [Bradyrhizobium sp. USDA 223]
MAACGHMSPRSFWKPPVKVRARASVLSRLALMRFDTPRACGGKRLTFQVSELNVSRKKALHAILGQTAYQSSFYSRISIVADLKRAVRPPTRLRALGKLGNPVNDAIWRQKIELVRVTSVSAPTSCHLASVPAITAAMRLGLPQETGFKRVATAADVGPFGKVELNRSLGAKFFDVGLRCRCVSSAFVKDLADRGEGGPSARDESCGVDRKPCVRWLCPLRFVSPSCGGSKRC